MEDVKAGLVSYVALSYVWGSTRALRPVVCNKARLSITCNLYDALRQFTLQKRPELFWIDAVCINQHDDDEKLGQIVMMADIYQAADVVFVWLGNTSALSEGSYLKKFWELISAYDERVFTNKPVVEPAIQAEMRFLESSDWFRRAWTFQEIILARRAVVLCGDVVAEWNKLAAMLIEHHGGTSAASFSFLGGDEYLELGDEKPYRDWRRARINPFASPQPASVIASIRGIQKTRSVAGQEHRLSTLIAVSLYRECTDPRDKLFALLGLWNGKLCRNIISSASVAEVYAVATASMLLEDGTWKVLRALDIPILDCSCTNTSTFITYIDRPELRVITWILCLPSLTVQQARSMVEDKVPLISRG